MPNTSAQKSGLMLHHTLGNGEFTVFEKMYRTVSCAVLNVKDTHNITEEIDDILKSESSNLESAAGANER